MGMLQEQGGRPAAQCQRTWVALAAALVCASVGAQEGATTATATTLSEAARNLEEGARDGTIKQPGAMVARIVTEFAQVRSAVQSKLPLAPH